MQGGDRLHFELTRSGPNWDDYISEIASTDRINYDAIFTAVTNTLLLFYLLVSTRGNATEALPTDALHGQRRRPFRGQFAPTGRQLAAARFYRR